MHTATGKFSNDSSFPTYSLIIVFASTISLFVCLFFYVWDTYRNFRDTQDYFHLTELSGNIANLDDKLTMHAKMAASTGDLKWEKRYRTCEKELNDAIDEAIAIETDLSIGRSMLKVDNSNRKLSEIANKAFKLVHARQLDAASYLLNNEDYENHKKTYRTGIDQISTLINAYVKNQCEEYHYESYITLVLATVAIPLLLLSWVSVSKMLRKYDSDREQFQERLMESEKRFRDLTENTSDWIWETNCQLQYIYTNPVVEDILGYSADEVLGKTIYDYTPEDEIPRLRAFALELKKNPKPFYNFENRNLHKNGSIRILETSGIPVYNNTGQIIGYRGIDRDITGRKEAEKALWQEKNLLNRITETSPIGITVMDRNGVIIYANHGAVSILGLSKEKITHLSFNSQEWHMTDFHGERILDDRMPFHLVRDTKKSVLNFRHAMEKPDGGKIFLSVNAAPLLDADGNFEGMVSAIEDITEQVKTETEMQRLIKELQTALADVRTLSGLLPICASCKKVRDDKGYWSSVEKYIQKRSSVKFSHGYCPDCYNKYCSEYFSKGEQPPREDINGRAEA